MVSLIFGLALFLPMIFAQPCEESGIGSGFSACDENLTRSAFFFWAKNCDPVLDRLPHPVFGLDCTMTCEPGEFLDFDVLE